MDAAAAATPTVHRSLDCTGLICPLPVLRARKALRDMAAGQVLEVAVTDPAAPRDFRAFCAEAGHLFLGEEGGGGDGTGTATGEVRLRLRKGG